VDVIVVGGGPARLAAAIASARQGVTPRALDLPALQRTLVAQGAELRMTFA
jgi:thioredoxin reductase